jgi:hypothetical protein
MSSINPAATHEANGYATQNALAAALEIARHLERYTYRWGGERDLQQGIGIVLARRFDVQAEVSLSRRDRPDFLVTVESHRVAVEVKISGARTAILQQLGRYAAHDTVDAVVLAAGRRALLVGIPDLIHRKPVVVAHTKAPLR